MILELARWNPSPPGEPPPSIARQRRFGSWTMSGFSLALAISLGVGFELVNRGCPPESKVVMDGVEVIDTSKCDPPIDGTLSGRLVVTSIAPLTLSVDATLARPDGNDVWVQGTLSTKVHEIHSSWTD